MRDYLKFYIDGTWVAPASAETIDVINPATEEVAGRIAAGTAADVDRAAKAARKAFAAYSQTTRDQRLELLNNLLAAYEKRASDVADAVTEEMGAPAALSTQQQVFMGIAHLKTAIGILKDYEFEHLHGGTMVSREPIGVCGLITPWNWPLNQIMTKVAPALATGCTMVLKPSEISPFSGQIFAEIVHDAGVPAGVFNLVQGYGASVGAAISSHPEIDMVSFTGSTRAGIEVAKNAAATVKRVHQELGGKSPNIILDDANLEKAVSAGIRAVMNNSGQSCNAPTRMLLPFGKMKQAMEIAKNTADGVTVGNPKGNAMLGPVANRNQWNKIQALIQKGIDEGATLVAGGTGRPDGLDKGFYVKPTVFANVTNEMTVAREEIFGPVVSMIGYGDEAEAIRIANDTEYGLAAYVQGGDIDRARKVARQLRAGQVTINGARLDFMAPFGGYKRSGNGREWGDHAFSEFLEVKAMIGYEPPPAKKA